MSLACHDDHDMVAFLCFSTMEVFFSHALTIIRFHFPGCLGFDIAVTVSENDSACPRYQAGLHDDIRRTSSLSPVTKLTFHIHAPTNHS
jgi:hypothetical protein